MSLRTLEFTTPYDAAAGGWRAVILHESGAKFFETEAYEVVFDALHEMREWAKEQGIITRPKTERSQSQLP